MKKLTFAAVLVLGTFVLVLGTALAELPRWNDGRIDDIGFVSRLYIGVAGGYSAGVSSMRRTDAGTIAVGPMVSYAPRLWGHTFLLDIEQGTDEDAPTGIGMAYVVTGDAGDSHLYVGGRALSRWTVEGPEVLGGPTAGFLLPINDSGTACYRVGFDVVWGDAGYPELRVLNGIEVSL